MTPRGLINLDWRHNSEDNLESSQLARLSLDQSAEFNHAPTQRTRDSLCTSTHKGRSSESTDSITVSNHSWISSSQSVQKVVSEAQTATHGTHVISRHWSRIVHDPVLACTYHREPLFPTINTSQTSNLGLFVSVCIQLCQVSTQVFRAGWRSKDVSMHLISRDSLDFNRVLPTCLLNPQRFDGNNFKTTAITSQRGVTHLRPHDEQSDSNFWT